MNINLFGSVQDKGSSSNSHDSTIFDTDTVFISQDFIHKECARKTGGISKCID